MDASWQVLLPVITTTAVHKEAEDTACHHYDRVARRGVAPQSMKSIEAVGNTSHHYDRGSYVVASRRRACGSTWRHH